MDISVLGPVEVRVDGHPVGIAAGKPRALLAVLALSEGSTVPTERLVDALWDGEPPASADKMVQLGISKLRRAFTDNGHGGQILTHGRGYELRLDDGEVDARRFEHLIADGRPREALALWRGAPLADVAEEPFAAAEIRRFQELRLSAIEQAVDLELAAGRHPEAAAELEALALQEPLRERLHAQRMLALYRCGRQAEALDAYREARAALVEQIGVEPGPQLRRLHEAILAQDPALELPDAAAAELPPELAHETPLVGREAELDWLREQWRRAVAGRGLLALVAGPAGIGKTRLIAELAVELHREGVAVLHASGAREAARTAVERAAGGSRPTLLVIDDLDGDGEDLRAALLRRPPGKPVLAAAAALDAGVVAADATLVLQPLDAAGVAAIAGLYADAPAPLVELMEASAGVPRRVHRAASRWARADAARRRDAAAVRAMAERAGLRAAEDDLAGSIAELEGASARSERPPGDHRVVCPFKGLAAFEPDDTDFFFGRERLVAEMVARLAGAPLMGIVGPSGSGKSSALRAGLLPALAGGVLPGSEGWRQVLLRPGARPSQALEQAAGHASRSGRLVIAVDQFEEAFTACRDADERERFVDALVAAARDPRGRALVLIAIRADFYGRCALYPELARLLGANHVLVGPMRRDELRRAIELPARRAGLRLDAGLADALLSDVEREPGALPLLSSALLELWQRRDGRRLTLAAYEHAGGVQGAVARLAERAYGQLDGEQRESARRILLRLAGEGAGEGEGVVRRRVALADLDAADVLSTLADARLITISEGEVEVAHEALLREWPRLRGWLEEDAQGRRLHRHLHAAAREWDAGGRDAGELYRGARLAAALDWSVTHAGELGPNERAFLDESRGTSERAHRRLRAVLTGVATLLALAVIAAVVALEQRGNARDQALVADAERLGARALAEDDIDRRVLLARQGVSLDDSVRTRGNLLAALVRAPAAIGVLRGDGQRMWTITLSPDERTLAAGDASGEVFLFDTRTKRRIGSFKPWDGNAWITQLAFSPDGRRLAMTHNTATGDRMAVADLRSRRVLVRLRPRRGQFIGGLRYTRRGTLDVVGVPMAEGASYFERFDARTGRRVLGPKRVSRNGNSPLLLTGDGRIVTGAEGEIVLRHASTLRPLRSFAIGRPASQNTAATALSPDDRTVALGGEEGDVRLLDLRTGSVRTAAGRHAGPVSASRFTPDGRNLITAGEDGRVIVWDVKQAAAAETLSGHANGVTRLAITGDRETLYSSSVDGTVLIWDLVGRDRLGQPFKTGPPDGSIPALSAGDRRLATGQLDGTITVVDLQTYALRTLPAPTDGPIGRVAFAPGSGLLVVTGVDGFLALVDSDSGRVVRRLTGHRAGTFLPSVSADGGLLALGSDDRTVGFWSLPDGRRLGARLRLRGAELWNAQLTPDGRRLVATVTDDGFESGRIEVYDARSRRLVRRLRVAVQPGPVRFSQDGGRMAIGYRDGSADVWSTQDWKRVSPSLPSDGSGISDASFSADGATLATGSETGTLRLWDVKTGEAIGSPLPGVPSVGVAPRFTRDGHKLIAAYGTGRAYAWDIRSQSLLRQACTVAGRRLTRAEWQRFLGGHDYDPAC